MLTDNAMTFKGLVRQLATMLQRMHFARCPVAVYQFANGRLAVSYQGRLRAR
jgi:hypothetical protein